MINDVIPQDMELNECKVVIKRIRKRIKQTMGIPPKSVLKPEYEILKKYKKYNLEHWLIKYKVLSDVYCKAIIVFPKQIKLSNKTPCILCLHGTTKLGKLGCLTPDKIQKSPYGIELVQRGYITFSPDQYWFGDYWKTNGRDWEGTFKYFADKFYKQYPDWSIDGRRLWDMQRAVDIISTLKFVRTNSIGAIGNSLGGRSVMYITAFDERIKAAVASTGVSPNITNVYRNIRKPGYSGYYLSPILSDYIEKTGKPIFEYQEMIAICAPRALLMIEPFNDKYNPYISTVIDCFTKAAKVYSLYNKPEHISLLVHGDGHGTLPDKREIAYMWFDRFLS